MSRKRTLFLTVIVLAVAANVLVFALSREGASGPRTVTVKIAGKPFNLELAMTLKEHEAGLMNRTSMPADHGMLFVFDKPAEQKFWMKNCLIPLDVVFVDEGGHIIKILTMAVPPVNTRDEALPAYESAGPVRYAIELNGGTAEKIGAKEGQSVAIPINDLKPAPKRDE